MTLDTGHEAEYSNPQLILRRTNQQTNSIHGILGANISPAKDTSLGGAAYLCMRPVMARTADSKAEYAAKFRDPQWQRRRLEIMQLDNFSCIKCGEKEKTLNVHHKFYNFGQEPWEYPDCALVTLCEECHEIEDEARREIPLQFLETLAIKGWLNSEMSDLIVLLDMILSYGDTPEQFSKFLQGYLIAKAEQAEGK